MTNRGSGRNRWKSSTGSLKQRDGGMNEARMQLLGNLNRLIRQAANSLCVKNLIFHIHIKYNIDRLGSEEVSIES